MPHLILTLAEKLEHLDLYSREGLEVIQRITDYPTGGNNSFTFVQKGPYERMQNEMREIIFNYLSSNAIGNDHIGNDQRGKVEAFKREISAK